jgi:hypothetical protein
MQKKSGLLERLGKPPLDQVLKPCGKPAEPPYAFDALGGQLCPSATRPACRALREFDPKTILHLLQLPPGHAEMDALSLPLRDF